MSTGGDRSTFATKTGWGQSGNLITGNRINRVTMQADFNKGVGAFDFTAQFNITPPNNGNAIVNAEALIHWRVEGQEVTRRLTIGAGATLTGVGQAVRVEMYDATPPLFYKARRAQSTATVTEGSPVVVFASDPGINADDTVTFSPQPKVQYGISEIDGNTVTLSTPYTGPSSTTATATVVFELPTQYGVSVQVSAGIRGSSAQPPLLQPYDGPPYVEFGPTNPSPGSGFLFIVDPGELQVISIPQDAGVNQVFVTVAPLFGNSGGLVPNVAFASIENGLAQQRQWDTQVVTGWVPVPPGAQIMLVSNNSVAGPGKPGPLKFSVAWGIDG
jgi:hypothetical protein